MNPRRRHAVYTEEEGDARCRGPLLPKTCDLACWRSPQLGAFYSLGYTWDCWKRNSKYHGRRTQKLSSLSRDSLSVRWRAVSALSSCSSAPRLQGAALVAVIQDHFQTHQCFSWQEGERERRGHCLPFKGEILMFPMLFLHIIG